MTRRRTFIVQISSIAAGALAGVVLSPLKTHREVSIDRLGFNHFVRLVGSPFYVLGQGGSIKLQLVEASAKGVREETFILGEAGEADAEEFSLIFEGTPERPLEQDTYVVTHARIGRFLIFMVPVGGSADSDGPRFYQAIFNRPAPLASLTP